MNAPHRVSEPNILYFGTPVVLVSTLNPDGTANLAPISSAFWLGWRGVIGIAASSQTTRNLMRTGECVLNLPSSAQAHAVDRIARTTGTHPVPESKRARGYVYEPDKFGTAGLAETPSQTVWPPRALECPIHLEAVVAATHGLADETPDLRGKITVFEVRIQRVHVHPDLLMDGHQDRIDPDKWSPLIMSFQKFYGLGPRQVHASRLAEIPERAYRSPDIERSRDAGVPAGAGR
ncbi:flavin reductase family protein [Burkholderia ambifaria]|jgi:flavin reductase (DIM6/NTAB) family NADH-FMN oxidoreductase RutF|uniref:flavin reductase family protein n=1 Tax=Burkholderia TaxID=32008 RepID=UPI00110E41DE|nr:MULTISPECIES: flavin reductase family protein [Burkholderia]MBR8062425.1 flavin reductase family protein [Burkholderia ambifaria]QDW54128.1 flavin reductase family protein [Burkholderia sp. KBS0801]